MGFFSTAMDWGLMIGPLIAGMIYDYLDLSRVFYFGGSMELVGVLVFAFLTRNLAKPKDGRGKG
jgi:predicted MFS family arabinose efflux permease